MPFFSLYVTALMSASILFASPAQAAYLYGREFYERVSLEEKLEDARKLEAAKKKLTDLPCGALIYISNRKCYGSVVDANENRVQYSALGVRWGKSQVWKDFADLENIVPLFTVRNRILLEDGVKGTIHSIYFDQKSVVVQRDDGRLERKKASEVFSTIGPLGIFNVGNRVYDKAAVVAVIVGFRINDKYGHSALVRYLDGRYQSWSLADLAPVNG